jgi:hypothetical protein
MLIDRLGLFSGKGSGEVENRSDFLLTLEKANSVNIPYREINVLTLTIHKNRRGGRTKFTLISIKRI